jgi:hypothetical protein
MEVHFTSEQEAQIAQLAIKLDFDTIFQEVVHCQWFGASRKV